MISSDHASKLLERVLYERVLECIDLRELYYRELVLGCALDESGAPEDSVASLAHDLIGRALDRVRHDERRHRHVPFSSGLSTDCDLCEQEARARTRPASPPRLPTEDVS